MLLCTVALWAWAVAVVLRRLRTLLLHREADAAWVRSLLAPHQTGVSR
jgi:hypothetical protein